MRSGRLFTIACPAKRARLVLLLALLPAGISPLWAQGRESLAIEIPTSRTPSDDEKLAWFELVDSEKGHKGEQARRFLERFPTSDLVPLARYFLAVEAFEEGDLAAFRREAPKALERFPELVRTDPRQRLRQLQLLSQLAFVEAESGNPETAVARARELVLEADQEAPTGGLSPAQWQEYRRELRATAEYVRGRALLGQSGADSASEEVLPEAVTHLRRATELVPQDSYSQLRLGSVLELLGEKEEAARSLARALLLGGAVAEPARRRLDRLVADPFKKSELVEAARGWLAEALQKHPRSIYVLPEVGPHPIYWWDAVPAEVLRAALPEGDFSNIRRRDYVGPERCGECHEDRYRGWLNHAHRRMNALADAANVVGDFSGAEIRYLGGRARFFLSGGNYFMELERGDQRRRYRIRRTIGSRFFQYYVGVLEQGPEPRHHPARQVDHVLPFGYWIDPAEWVPVVHIGPELADGYREDPFQSVARFPYDRSCSACHTTRPLGDWMLMTDGRMRLGAFSPRTFSFDMGGYLESEHPAIFPKGVTRSMVPLQSVSALLRDHLSQLPAVDFAVNLGISCEACHNGGRLHAEASTPTETRLRPRFFPSGPLVQIQDQSSEEAWGRTPKNLNFICSRCHSGGRPQFAGGMDTWNSTEYSDAVRGACYEAEAGSGLPSLTCVHCHDPHFTIGKKWSRPAGDDDGRCLSCHDSLVSEERRRAHTHHPAGSEGDRCMNCHMPRINEGMQDLVRTHQIFSPTRRDMLESNQPNACNLCHLDRPISWTLKLLESWYGEAFDGDMLQAYRDLAGPAGLGWLQSEHEATRLVAGDALIRERASWALPQLLDLLNDPYLINRQFTQRNLEGWLNIDLSQEGYRFYDDPASREKAIRKIRQRLLPAR